MKPRVFIGSSAEGESIADAIQQNLQRYVFPVVWTQGIFGPGQTNIDALLAAVTDNDFGVFVLSNDDIMLIRENQYASARDNVLLEAALFMGRYARDRAYLVKPMGVKDFHIPSDLLGLNLAEYDPKHAAHNAVAAVGPACNQIRTAIDRNQSYNRRLTVNIRSARGGNNYPLKLWLQLRNQTGVDVVIKAHHFLCNGSLRVAPNATGNRANGEYEIKFPDGNNNLTLFNYLLNNGDSVETWLPIDPAHTDADVQGALNNPRSGEFHFTYYWLDSPPISRRYVIPT